MVNDPLSILKNQADAPKELKYPPPSISGGNASTSGHVHPPRPLTERTLKRIQGVISKNVGGDISTAGTLSILHIPGKRK
jgi:hypothetical protein